MKMEMKAIALVYWFCSVLFIWAHSANAAVAGSFHAYDLAKYITRHSKGAIFKEVAINDVESAVKVLCTGQNAMLKSVDGLTHMLRNTGKDSSSLMARHERFIRRKQSSKLSSRTLKEAAKLIEYVTAVERGLQAAEIIQAVQQQTPSSSTHSPSSGNKRNALIEAAGLEELKRSRLCVAGYHFTVSVLHPQRQIKQIERERSKEKRKDQPRGVKRKQNKRKQLRSSDSSSNSNQIGKAAAGLPRFLPDELVVVISDDGTENDSTNSENVDSNLFVAMDIVLKEKPIFHRVKSRAAVTSSSPPPPTTTTSIQSKVGRSGRKASPATGGSDVLLRVNYDSEVLIQPTVLEMAAAVLREIEEYIPLPVTASAVGCSSPILDDTGNTKSSANISDDDNEEEEDDEDEEEDEQAEVDEMGRKRSTVSSVASTIKHHHHHHQQQQQQQIKLRVLGHSLGGAVGAYVSMILDGSLNNFKDICSVEGGLKSCGSVSSADEDTVHTTGSHGANSKIAHSSNSENNKKRSTDKKYNREKKKESKVNMKKPHSTYATQQNIKKEHNKGERCVQQLNNNELLLLNCSHHLIGACKDSVQCLALGPPPCLSRSLIPRFVTTVVCGDDILPRATQQSLQTLLDRVQKEVTQRSGSGNLDMGKYSISAMSNRFFGDALASSKRGLQHYRRTRKDNKNKEKQESGKSKSKVTPSTSTSATTAISSKEQSESAAVNELCLPGRVFFVKRRVYKSGATIQRVLRGNWQEDLLWQIRDVVLSPKMKDHHTLVNYIQTLNRC